MLKKYLCHAMLTLHINRLNLFSWTRFFKFKNDRPVFDQLYQYLRDNFIIIIESQDIMSSMGHNNIKKKNKIINKIEQ